MASPNPIAHLLFTDAKIIICQSTIKPLGGLNEAVLFAQLAYWSERAKDKGALIDGERWAFRTQEQLEEETGLTPFQQRSVRAKLVALNVLEERRYGIPAKLFYRVKFDEFCALMESDIPDADVKKLENRPQTNSTSLKGRSEKKGKDGDPDGSSGGAKITKRAPSGPAQEIVAAYCIEAGIEKPASYGAAVGLAQQLADAGITAEDIPALYAFVVAWAGGADLALMLKQADRWRSDQRRTAKKKTTVLF